MMKWYDIVILMKYYESNIILNVLWNDINMKY